MDSNFKKQIENIKKVINEKSLPGANAHNQLFPENRNNFPVGDKSKAIQSAVLLLLFPDKNGNMSTVFMKRNDYPGHHSKQISFPGGKTETEDKNLKQTAIREAHEEIGVLVSEENIIGKLSELYIPISNFNIHPYVGYIKNKPTFKPDKAEVDALIEISLSELVQLQISTTKMIFEGNTYNIPYFPLKGEILWGATAMIVNEFIMLNR